MAKEDGKIRSEGNMKAINLNKNEALKIDHDTEIQVESGILWITFANDRNDVILYPNQKLKLSKNKLPVIEALSTASFQDLHAPCPDKKAIRKLGLARFILDLF